MLVNRDTLAIYFDLSPGRITQLCHEGVLSKVSRNRYDVAQCLQQFIDFKLQGGASGTRDVTEARTALYLAQVHKTELETSRIKREMIPADEHLADMHALQGIFDTSLDGLDNSLACDIAELNDAAAIADRLTLATNAVRESVADNIVAYSKTLH